MNKKIKPLGNAQAVPKIWVIFAVTAEILKIQTVGVAPAVQKTRATSVVTAENLKINGGFYELRQYF